MKIKISPTSRFVLLCTAVTVSLLTFGPSARAIGIAGATSRSSEPSVYINHLIDMALGTQEGSFGQHLRSANDFSPRPQAVLAQHMNSSNLRDVIAVPSPDIIQLGGPPGGIGGAVPDGGVTAMLLGIALSALGMARRYIMR